MSQALRRDLKKLQARAFNLAEWAEDVLRRYHSASQKLDAATAQRLKRLYHWMFVPTSLCPFNIQDVLTQCLATLEKGKRLNSRQCLITELLPEPPDETVCAAVADHEFHVQSGDYENLIKTRAKYSQHELKTKADAQLFRQWVRLKATFDVRAYCDYKGVIRRSMSVERNLHPSFSVNLRRRDEAFQVAFDAFCLRWNLYGMQHDEPLPLKLAVNLTPYGTMIHIPAYWSFDPKRDLHWDVIAKLHRVRVPGRQGSALVENFAERLVAAKKLRQLDRDVRRRRLRGEEKHAFLCAGLGWDARTSPKRLSRLRAEFKSRNLK